MTNLSQYSVPDPDLAEQVVEALNRSNGNLALATQLIFKAQLPDRLHLLWREAEQHKEQLYQQLENRQLSKEVEGLPDYFIKNGGKYNL